MRKYALSAVVSDSLRPQGLEPASLLCPWDFPSKNTGVGGHFLFQRIFPTQGSNPCLLHVLSWQGEFLLSRLRNLMMGDAEMGIHRVAGCAGGGIQDEASHLVSAAGNCHPGEGQGGGPGISRQQPAFQRGSTSHPLEP